MELLAGESNSMSQRIYIYIYISRRTPISIPDIWPWTFVSTACSVDYVRHILWKIIHVTYFYVLYDDDKGCERNTRDILKWLIFILCGLWRTFRYLRKIIPTYLPHVTECSTLWIVCGWEYRANECYGTPYLFVKNTPEARGAVAGWKTRWQIFFP